MIVVCGLNSSHLRFGYKFYLQGATAAVRARLTALEEKHKDVEGKMTQMLLSQSESTSSLDEVKSMLKKCMERFSSAEGFSPSVGVSAVETQAQLGSTKMQVVRSVPTQEFKTPAAVVSIHISEGSGDSDTHKLEPLSPQGQSHHPSHVEEDHVQEGLSPPDVNQDADMVSTQTPAAVSALVHLGGPVQEVGLLSKPKVADIERDQGLAVDSPLYTAEEAIGVVAANEPEEEKTCKSAEAPNVPQESKKAPRARKLKKVIESSEEESPISNCKKVVAPTEVVELSPDGISAGVSTRLRSSPKKAPVQVNPSVEESAAGEEDSTKVGRWGIQVHSQVSHLDATMLQLEADLNDVVTVIAEMVAGEGVCESRWFVFPRVPSPGRNSLH